MQAMSLKRSRLRLMRLPAPGALAALLSLALSGVSPAHADSKAKDRAQAADGKTHKMVSINQIDLPRYSPPPSFREDLVITTKDDSFTMKRFVDHASIRTEMKMKDDEIVMIEAGDAKGTTYTLMPKEKRAMKQSRQAMAEASGKAKAKMPEGEAGAPDAKGTPPPDMQVEDLGDETLDGNTVKKLRMVAGGGDVLGWFDKGTGAPVRMESLVDGKMTTLEWKNRKVEPQPAELFTVPKGYEVMDMDEMMSKMGGMGAMGGMGGVGGMAKGMAGGMVQGMGSNLGGSIGATLGGSLGGPLGAAAGQFLGGKIGGMLGKKAANAIN
jgi:hypothetical protein